MRRLPVLTTQELADALAERLKADFDGRDMLSCWDQLLTYLQAKLVTLKTEEVRVLFLTTKNALIADEVHSRGTINECPIHIRELIHRALDLGAGAIILAHNHPSGDPTPSEQDIRFTRKLRDAAEPLGIALHDHVIVGGSARPVSMRAQGCF